MGVIVSLEEALKSVQRAVFLNNSPDDIFAKVCDTCSISRDDMLKEIDSVRLWTARGVAVYSLHEYSKISFGNIGILLHLPLDTVTKNDVALGKVTSDLVNSIEQLYEDLSKHL